MSNSVAYELSTFGKTLDFLKANFGTVHTSEYFPDKNIGEVHNGIMNQDVTRLTYEASKFDLVTSSQVFEHVLDDLRGFSECCRVLKSGGAFIFSIPLYNTAATHQISRMKDGKIEWLITPPEYHDSRLGGPESAPVFWRHSKQDIVERVLSAGFSKVELVDVVITPIQVEPMQVVYSIK